MHFISKNRSNCLQMTKIILVIAAVLASANATLKRCPANEVFSICGNNACQNTCAYPNIAPLCKPICTPGCICKNGYLRNTRGVCVPPVQCDTCKPNEIFDLCRNTMCQNTCAEPDLQIRCKPLGCIAGCVCRPGYLRNENRDCVRPEQCKPKCNDPNEVFTPCGDVCPITCANKDQIRICPAVCRIDGGCVCKPGYVRSWKGVCIKPKQCPTCSGPNEFYSCGSACDTTCATLGDTCPIVNIRCNERCYCKNGFARNNRNVCIPIKKCPPRQCPNDPNAIIVPCGDPCPVTCENKDDPGTRTCIKLCIINGCKCKSGYVIGKNGKCIPIGKCPVRCPKNEHYDRCPPACPNERDCNAYMSGAPDVCSLPHKCVRKCRCNPGFVRRNSDGRCVRPAQCCTDPNSQLVSCPNPCPGGTCLHPAFIKCRIPCRRYGCQCKNGFVKKSIVNSKCVPLKQCSLHDIIDIIKHK
ncbi:zonadhesin-like [Arctopsyche grandis]|uniref:zonadhesin-like n=1 Tax=Arctopsyche grandis TaxID=121162 RepID=UPI00406D77C5